MLISLNWLKDFVNIPKAITPQELGLRLTMHTVEIDSVVRQADKFANVVVGKILEVKEHPNADRLRLALVDTGKEKLKIVCGAPNIEVGQLVPVALIGAVLPNGMEIREAEVRGEKSCGMLCAEDELGLGNDHSGILILDKKAKIGQNLSDYLNLKDIVFEVDNKSITNRPDLWSHYGLAREIASFLGVKLKEYKFNKKLLEKSIGDIKLEAKVDDFSLCPRYMAVAVGGIKTEDSPKWMQDRLIAVGVRPINNIVDITNYVLMELGQPLHAFDAGLLGDKIIVRRARDKEIIKTLDGEKRELDKNDIIITDGKKPVAIGGVMGGANSEINSETESIIIESANFNYISIRKTSQRLGLRTESSIRFEKGLDPNLAELALARTVELVKKLCPKAKIVSNLIDASAALSAGEKKFKLNQRPIELDLEWLEKRIGERIDDKKVVKILESLGFVIETQTEFGSGCQEPSAKTVLRVTVPTWRATRDISIPEDLVEEVARIYGFNNLRASMPKVEMQAPKISQERLLERKIRNILTGAPALTEVYNYSFVGEVQLNKLNIDSASHIRLVNPISEHQAMLRQSLAPNLINNIKANQARVDLIALFEIGTVYFPTAGELERGGGSGGQLPYQEKRIGIIFGADSAEGVFNRAKGTVEHLTASLNLSVQFKRSEAAYNWADRQTCAMIEADGKTIGSVVKFDSRLREGLGLKKEAAVAEISFPELLSLVREKGEIKYREPGKYPPAVRDLAFVVPAKILYNDIKDEILNFSPLIKKAELFDVYTGEKLGQNKKSLAFHITYQTDRTLTSEEVDGLQKKLIKELEERFEAKIRDF